jgi:hypothetical protein
MTTIQEHGVMPMLDHLNTYSSDLDTFSSWLAGKAAEWGDLPHPYLATVEGTFGTGEPLRLRFNVMCLSAEQLADVGRLLAAGAPIGSVRKEYDDCGPGFVRITRSFGLVELEAWALREDVCERILDGVETVWVPDPDAPCVAVEKPRYRWECKPVFQAVNA